MLVNTTLHWWEPAKGVLKRHEGGNLSLYYIVEDNVSGSVQHKNQSLSVWQLTPCCRCVGASLEETKSDPSKCTWMVKILCKTKCLILTVHVYPLNDSISGLLITSCLWVLLNHILCDTGRSIWFVWAVKTECASISYMQMTQNASLVCMVICFLLLLLLSSAASLHHPDTHTHPHTVPCTLFTDCPMSLSPRFPSFIPNCILLWWLDVTYYGPIFFRSVEPW